MTTRIQIKRGTVDPTGLTAGEFAYNVETSRLFLGNTASQKWIGGEVTGGVDMGGGSAASESRVPTQRGVYEYTRNSFVGSVNGATGAVTDVARTVVANTFTALQSFSAGISAGGGITFAGLVRITDTTASTTTSTGALTVAGGAGISGSAFVGGALTVDTNVFHVDAANNRVGIGTTSPTELLYLNASGAGGIGVNVPSAFPYYKVYIAGTEMGGFFYGSTATKEFIFQNTYGGSLVFKTSSPSPAGIKMIVTEGGNLGVGTNTPGASLDVVGSVRASGLGTFTAGISAAGATVSGRLLLYPTASGTGLTALSAFGGIHFTQAGGNDNYVGMTTTGGNDSGTQGGVLIQGSGSYGTKIHFLTTDSYAQGMKQRMILDHLGRFGIGTVSPSVELDVVGSAAVSGTITAAGATFTGIVTGTTAAFTGNVGIGAGATAAYRLYVDGAFAATTKSFVIPHPTEGGKSLRYGSLEGPENGVYVRGRSRSNVVFLPPYWRGLVDESSITVNITPVGGKQDLWVAAVDTEKVIVYGSDTPHFFYTVWGERKDVPRLEVEF